MTTLLVLAAEALTTIALMETKLTVWPKSSVSTPCRSSVSLDEAAMVRRAS